MTTDTWLSDRAIASSRALHLLPTEVWERIDDPARSERLKRVLTDQELRVVRTVVPAWLEEHMRKLVAFYRQFGFFASEEPDAVVGRQLLYRCHNFGSIVRDDVPPDWCFLAGDEKRALLVDPGEGPRYAELVTELGKRFSPPLPLEGVSVEPEADGRRVRLHVKVSGVVRTLGTAHGRRLDLRFSARLDPLGAPGQLVWGQWRDGYVAIVVQAEARRAMEARGVRFCSLVREFARLDGPEERRDGPRATFRQHAIIAYRAAAQKYPWSEVREQACRDIRGGARHAALLALFDSGHLRVLVDPLIEEGRVSKRVATITDRELLFAMLSHIGFSELTRALKRVRDIDPGGAGAVADRGLRALASTQLREADIELHGMAGAAIADLLEQSPEIDHTEVAVELLGALGRLQEDEVLSFPAYAVASVEKALRRRADTERAKAASSPVGAIIDELLGLEKQLERDLGKAPTYEEPRICRAPLLELLRIRV